MLVIREILEIDEEGEKLNYCDISSDNFMLICISRDLVRIYNVYCIKIAICGIVLQDYMDMFNRIS